MVTNVAELISYTELSLVTSNTQGFIVVDNNARLVSLLLSGSAYLPRYVIEFKLKLFSLILRGVLAKPAAAPNLYIAG